MLPNGAWGQPVEGMCVLCTKAAPFSPLQELAI